MCFLIKAFGDSEFFPNIISLILLKLQSTGQSWCLKAIANCTGKCLKLNMVGENTSTHYCSGDKH